MVDDWASVPLGEVADEVTVGFVGSMASEYVDVGIPFLRSLNVRPHRIQADDLRYISADFHRRIKKSKLCPGDVVTVRTGKPGATAVIPEWLPDANCSDLVITRPGPNLDARWLSYYINGAADGFVSSRLVGAVQQHFNVGAAKEMELLLPPLSEQRAIAATLGALDDKIESNRRAVGKAQELGDALFVSASGERRVISEIATITMGTSPKGDTLNEAGDGVQFYQGTRDFGFRFPSQRIWTTNPIRMARRNDTLMSVRAPVGELNMALGDCCVGRGVAAIHSENQPSTLYYAMRASRVSWNKFQGEGTVFSSVNKQDVHGTEIHWIGEHHAERLEKELSSLDQRIESLEAEMERLGTLRNALLPELLSGRVRVTVEGVEA